MSIAADIIALPIVPTLEQAATRAWKIRHLYREGALDRMAAILSLSCLHQHPHQGIRRLCVRVAEDVNGLGAKLGDTPEAAVEAFRR